MDWREAFLRQARSDFQVMGQLSRSGAEACRRLHYLQMATEKLARGWGMSAGSLEPPSRTYAGFVRLLQHIQAMPWIRWWLGYDDHLVFSRFVRSLLDVARKLRASIPFMNSVRVTSSCASF